MSLRLHAQFVRISVAARMTYRTDYLVSILAMFIAMLIGPLFVSAIYSSGGVIPGWTLPELLLLQGTVLIIKGVSFMLFFGILWGSQDSLRSGTFDLLLIRPISTLHLLIMKHVDVEDIGQFVSGIAVTAFAFWLLPPTHGNVILYLVLVFAGILFYLALAIFAVVTAIRFIDTGRLYEIVDGLTVFAMYPQNMYGKGLGLAFSTVLPLLIAGSYPASALLGKAIDGAWLALACCAGFLALALWAWSSAMKHYTSAGG